MLNVAWYNKLQKIERLKISKTTWKRLLLRLKEFRTRLPDLSPSIFHDPWVILAHPSLCDTGSLWSLSLLRIVRPSVCINLISFCAFKLFHARVMSLISLHYFTRWRAKKKNVAFIQRSKWSHCVTVVDKVMQWYFQREMWLSSMFYCLFSFHPFSSVFFSFLCFIFYLRWSVSSFYYLYRSMWLPHTGYILNTHSLRARSHLAINSMPSEIGNIDDNNKT